MLRKIKQLLGSRTHTFLVYGPDTRCNVVITAESGEEAIELAKAKKPGCDFTSYTVL